MIPTLFASWRSFLIPFTCAAVLLSVLVGVVTVGEGSGHAATVSAGRFDDDDGGVHEPSIDALGREGILDGTECGDRLFCPEEPLLRWVMAVWLVRALGETQAAASAGTTFSDVDSSAWWAPYVQRLVELGVTRGCSTEPLRFCPEKIVTRAQMATFLARALELEEALPAGFVDTAGNTHETSIDALAAASITAGCATDPPRYCPEKPVTRAQMATFLVRAFDVVVHPTGDSTSRFDRLAPTSCSGPSQRSAMVSDQLIAFPRYGRAGHHSDIFVVDPDGMNLLQLTNELQGTSPAWSPDSGRVAFANNNFIYVVDADGTDLRRLNDVDSLGDDPVWSPDGQHIAFVGRRETRGLHVVRADGKDLRQIFDRDLYSTPVWSPNGTRLAFTAQYIFRKSSISSASNASGGVVGLFATSYIPRAVYVVNADGSDLEELVQGSDPSWSPDGNRLAFDSGSPFNSGSRVLVMDVDGTGLQDLASGYEPIWSPDGSRIAFTKDGTGLYDSDLWVVDPTGSNLEQLTTGHRDRYPSWSPDSTRLAFTRTAKGLFTIDVNSGHLEQVTISDDRDDRPVWSPDGSHLAFTRTYNTRTVVADTKEGVSWLLTDDIASEDPVWSPDGSRVAFIRDISYYAPSGESILYVADYDGGNLIRLTNGDLFAVKPAWSPDGNCIAFAGYLKEDLVKVEHSVSGVSVDEPRTRNIFVVNVNDGRIYRATDNDHREDRNPTWSPDGTYLAFRSSPFSGALMIHMDSGIVRNISDEGFGSPTWSPDGSRLLYGDSLVIEADGSGSVRISDGEYGIDNPVWAPDGSRIAFVTQRGEYPDTVYEIRVIDIESRSSGVLTEGQYPMWSPDGTRIAFTKSTDPEYGRSSIFVIDSDGTGERKLTDHYVAPYCARWSPDGGRIAFVGGWGAGTEVYVIDADGTDLQRITDNNYEDDCPIWSQGPRHLPAGF